MTKPLDLSYQPTLKLGRLYWSIPDKCMVKLEDCKYHGPDFPNWDHSKAVYKFWKDGIVGDDPLNTYRFRKPTFREFCYYLDPQTTKRKVGANRALPFQFAILVVLACMAALLFYGAPSPAWWWFMFALILAIPSGAILWTMFNYRTQWR